MSDFCNALPKPSRAGRLVAATACQGRHETPGTHLGRPERLEARRPSPEPVTWIGTSSTTPARPGMSLSEVPRPRYAPLPGPRPGIEGAAEGSAAAMVEAVDGALGLLQGAGDLERAEADHVAQDQHLAPLDGKSSRASRRSSPRSRPESAFPPPR